MSTVAKIFVVLNLVFALIYAGVAATLLQKQEHWKYQFHKEQAAHKDTERTLGDKLNKANEDKSVLVKEVDSWRNKCDALDTQLEAQKNDNINLEKKWDEMKGNYESLVEKYDALAQDLAKIQRQKDELQQLQNQTLAEKVDAVHRMDQSIDDRQRLQQQLEDLKIDLGNLKQRHVALAKKKSELEWVITSIQEKVGADVIKGVLVAVPKIDGSVVGVSSKVNLVVVSIGEDDGVRVGFEFTVYRGNSYVGKLIVEKVFPRQAACRVLLNMTKDKIQQGDRVSTQVY